jgi:ubiquinone/menaquinone biosynthesis C-methylase UbiE
MMTIDFKRLDIQAGDRILDLGCGEGRHCINAYILHPEVDVVGVDLSAKDLSIAHERFQDFAEPENSDKSFSLFCANGLSLPFADKSFDKIICSEVLEHIPDYAGMLVEINRLLKDDGLLAISVPRRWPEKICWKLSEAYHLVKGGHIRIFKARELHKEIENYGLSRYAHHWAHALHSPYWWLKCLFWDKGDEQFLVKAYHRLLVWDLMQKPWITQTLERLLNPIMGKSVVMYFKRDASL